MASFFVVVGARERTVVGKSNLFLDAIHQFTTSEHRFKELELLEAVLSEDATHGLVKETFHGRISGVLQQEELYLGYALLQFDDSVFVKVLHGDVVAGIQSVFLAVDTRRVCCESGLAVGLNNGFFESGHVVKVECLNRRLAEGVL